MAESVIELGNHRFAVQDQAMLADAGAREPRIRADLGSIHGLGQESTEGGIFGTLLGFLGDGLGTLGDVIGFPLGLIAQGADFVIDTLADLVSNIPIVGELIADLLQAGNTLLGAGLSLPENVLDLLGTLLKGFNKADKSVTEPLKKQSEQKIQTLAASTGQQDDVIKSQKQGDEIQKDIETKDAIINAVGVAAPPVAGAVAGALLWPVLGPVPSLLVGGGIAGMGWLVESVFDII